MAARENLIESWRKQLAIATPRRKQSDIVGAICYASLLNRSKHLEKWLVLLSDMRNATPLLDLENVAEIDDEESLSRIRKVGLMPDLSGFHVVVLGAHTLGISSLAYYKSLEAFWQAFFDAAHAELITFQPDRSWAPFGQENGKVKIPQKAK
jgi:hypothetical protein